MQVRKWMESFIQWNYLWLSCWHSNQSIKNGCMKDTDYKHTFNMLKSLFWVFHVCRVSIPPYGSDSAVCSCESLGQGTVGLGAAEEILKARNHRPSAPWVERDPVFSSRQVWRWSDIASGGSGRHGHMDREVVWRAAGPEMCAPPAVKRKANTFRGVNMDANKHQSHTGRNELPRTLYIDKLIDN